jgi:DAK2 domain fusion protein YloV
MLMAAGESLQSNIQLINDLNVFPVPDGDTGTNMNKTFAMGLEQLQARTSSHIGQVAESFSKGLLLGARGNSGVILSQLFRGFAKALVGMESATTAQFANAIQLGVDTAFRAVVKPVEGTILTVARDAAKHGQAISKRTTEFTSFLTEIHKKANEVLALTPEQLPVLKQAGVVDSGGQGLVFIYSGFITGLTNEGVTDTSHEAKRANPKLSYAPIEISHIVENAPAQTKIDPKTIAFIYDMEFVVRLNGVTEEEWAIQTKSLQQALEKVGDSIVVVADDQVVKVHVHAQSPGDILNIAIQYGEMSGFHLENMKERHEAILAENLPKPTITKPFGIVVVASGAGVQEIFTSLGVDIVLDGGQSMNPSAEDLLIAIQSTQAEHVFVLPNNSNIQLTAKQAAELASQQVTVVPTRTIQQGFEAALAFTEAETAEEMEKLMHYAIAQVRSGQIASAVRDSNIDGVTVEQDDYIGILEDDVVVSAKTMERTASLLLEKMITSGEEIVSIFTGEDADEAETDAIVQALEQAHPNIEVEVIPGGQPIYTYLIGVEK